LLEKLERVATQPPPIPPRIAFHPFYAQSTPPGQVPDAVLPEVKRLGLEGCVRDLKERGYAVVKDAADAATIVALRDTVAAGWRARPRAVTALLGTDPIYTLAATNPKICALAEATLGQGFILSSMGSSLVKQVPDDPTKRRHAGEELHCDQFMLPAPFPVQPQTLVFCWALQSDFTEEAGATRVVEGSHLLRRHPTAAESAMSHALSHAIEAQEGDIICWEGGAWHSKGTRTIPGERLVLHMTFHRMTYRPVESFSLPLDVLEANPLLAQLTGMADHWGRTGGVEDRKVASMGSWDDAVLKGRGVHPVSSSAPAAAATRVNQPIAKY
jgi:ectoine hydroxylase-related dioxygenase (phytanoyl-CoA dioxygenase family)